MASARFLAAFPAIQSAIKIYGNRDGMRIQLDVPETEMAEAVKLLQWRERVLVVTVEPETVTVCNDEAGKGTEGSSYKVGRRRIRNR